MLNVRLLIRKSFRKMQAIACMSELYQLCLCGLYLQDFGHPYSVLRKDIWVHHGLPVVFGAACALGAAIWARMSVSVKKTIHF